LQRAPAAFRCRCAVLRVPGYISTACALVYDGAHGRWRSRTRGGAESIEEKCDGPAKSGAVGNVDVSAAKVKVDEIKTDGIINLTPEAIAQVAKLRASRGGEEPVLRVGVRAGGCRSSVNDPRSCTPRAAREREPHHSPLRDAA